MLSKGAKIRVRLDIARSIMSNLANIWKDDDVSIILKKICEYSLVWSIAHYGSESRTLKEEYEKYIHTLEVWV